VKTLVISLLLLASSLATAGEKLGYLNWEADLSGQVNEAYTINGPQSSFGMFCSADKCLFYLHQALRCQPGEKYSVLMNSPPISAAIRMECTLVGGNLFQILEPFDQVMKGVQNGETIGFAVALQSGAFAANSFSLLGAKQAINRVMQEANQSKLKKQNPAPAIPQNTPKKSTGQDIKI
jgi:hypothetical protein